MTASGRPHRTAPAALALALACTGVLSACTGTSEPPGQAVSPAPLDGSERTNPPTPSTPGPPDTPPATSVTGSPSDVQVVAGGLVLPWSVVPAPGDGWLVSLRDEARVVHVSRSGTVAPVAATGADGRVPDVVPGGEGGLLGLALADDRLYAYLTTEVGGRTENAVVRMRLRGDAATGFSLGEPEPVLTGIPGARTHNGGRLAFGPDGMLYVTTGDARDTASSQDPGSLGGKILRITPDGDPAPGNPFAGSPVWSLGHRNVQGIGWDADGRMFASEFGQNRLDELNLIEPGGNYGWPLVEGGGGDERFVDPLVTWSTSEASPSGLAVTGDAVYLAALRGQRLWRVPLAPAGDAVVGPPTDHLVGEHGRLRDVAVDGTDLLVLTNGSASTGEPDSLLRVSLR